MEIKCIRELNIHYLKGVRRSGNLQILIRPDRVILNDLYKAVFEEDANISYMEVNNFVKISERLIAKQIFDDGKICISVKGDDLSLKK